MGSIFSSLSTLCSNLATHFEIWSLDKYHLIHGKGLSLIEDLQYIYHSLLFTGVGGGLQKQVSDL